MKIKKLTLKNFRQFKDMTLEFSNDPTKNVTVILAENSTGKTTLMQSIKWCLYGDSETNLDNLNELINFSVIDSSINEKEKLWVEVVINNNDTDYIIKRIKEVHVNSRRKASEIVRLEFKRDDGETIILQGDPESIDPEVKKIKRMINSILTKDMASYFLFDGERIDGLGRNDSKSRQDIKEAINAINDFTIINNAINSLKILSRQYNKRISTESNDKELQGIFSDINIQEDEIERLEKEIKITSDSIRKDKEKIEELDEDLNRYEDIEEFVGRRINLERQYKRDEKRLSENKELLTEYSSYRKSSLIFLLNEKYKEIEFNRDYEDNTIPGMETRSIEHIIESGYCICGEKLTEGHLKKLLDQKEYQPPLSPADLINTFNRIIGKKSGGIDKQVNIINREIKDYINLQNSMRDKKDELDELSDKIDNSNLEDIARKNNLRKDLNKATSQDERSLGVSEHLLVTTRKNLEDKKREREIKLLENEENKINRIKLDLINETYNDLDRRNEKYRKDKKSEIEAVANKHFSDIIYKNKRITINDNFEYQVLEANNQPASPSEGERIAISMSLVLAIIEVHKNKTNQPVDLQEMNSSVNEFCLVLDAAFAKLDTQFSSKISEKLPVAVEQIILFSTKRQFKGSVENSLNDYIGQKYKLEISNDSENNMLTNKDLNLLEVGF